MTKTIIQRTFKAVCVIALLCCCALFGMIVYAHFVVPDEISVRRGDKINIPSVFTVRINDTSADRVCVSTELSDELRDNVSADISILNVIPVKTSKVTSSNRVYVYPLGNTFGIKLYTEGVLVVKTDEVMTDDGVKYPAKEAGIKAGDIITEVNGKKAERNEDISDAFAAGNGKEVDLKILRDGNLFNIGVKGVRSSLDGKYRAGIWVRDSSAGIGTLTFYDKATDIFAGLGHAVCDVDTGKILPLSGGEAVNALIKGSYRGKTGAPGELCGVFGNQVIGKLIINSDTGVYGEAENLPLDNDSLPVAMSYEIKTGPAKIISEVDENGAAYYDVEIEKVFQNTDTHQKNMVIKVVDSDLIRKTGGIVQGMSGSPIIQNDMIVGAVTHVFISDPLKGYAIFAQTMVKTERDHFEQNSLPKAS